VDVSRSYPAARAVTARSGEGRGGVPATAVGDSHRGWFTRRCRLSPCVFLGSGAAPDGHCQGW
jgi:hypothetical protein